MKKLTLTWSGRHTLFPFVQHFCPVNLSELNKITITIFIQNNMIHHRTLSRQDNEATQTTLLSHLSILDTPHPSLFIIKT